MAIDTVFNAFPWIIGKLLYLVGYVFSKLIYIGGLILNWVLALNGQIIDNPAVQTGWQITRDFSNLAFVLLIIVIAFSTILRLDSFQLKKTLPKLILAALLINFSIIIATFFLDAAGITMNYFMTEAFTSSTTASGQKIGLSQALVNSFNLGSALGPPAITKSQDLSNWGAGILKYLTDMVFIDIMTIIGTITIFAMTIMYLIRYVYIGILLIMMPLAIIAWIIDSKVWGEWLDKFLKYTFFGPIAMFFVYIALVTSTSVEGSALGALGSPTDDPTGIATQFASKLGSMVMMVAILMGGLMAAEKMSIMGSKTAVSVANGAWKGVLKGTASTGLGLAGKIPGMGWAAKKIEGTKNSKYGLIRSAMRPLRQTSEAAKDFQKNYGGISGIYTATTEGIAEGLGYKAREARLTDEKAYEQRESKTKEIAKKLALARGISEEEATKAVTEELDKTKDSPDGKETALDIVNKKYSKEMDQRSAMKDLGLDYNNATQLKEFEKTMASNQDNIAEAKKSIRGERRLNFLKTDLSTAQGNLSGHQTTETKAQKDITRLQGELTRTTNNLAGLNPVQLKSEQDRINQEITKTNQDLANAQKGITEETKNIANLKKEIRNSTV
jgi:hypothetical protein